MLLNLVGAIAPLVIVVLAFSLILGGPAGPRLLTRALGRAIGFLLKRTVLLGLFVIITAIDAGVTTVRALYHIAVPLQAWRTVDDWLEFLFRLNDRFFKLALA